MSREKRGYARMSAEDYKRLHPRFASESAFEAWVIRILKTNGWLVSSMKDSRKQRWDADPGIPDIVAVIQDRRDNTWAIAPRLLFAELKMPRGRTSKPQKKWLDALSAFRRAQLSMLGEEESYAVEVYLWRPEDEEEIIQTAGGKLPL